MRSQVPIKPSLIASFLILMGPLLLCPLSCKQIEPPLKIGFVGPLSGKFSDLGVGARNGITLALEEINKTRGIKGRRLDLTTRDDHNNSEIAKQVAKELIDLGAVAIIGPMTSEIARALIPIINEKKVVTISPTVSSDEFTGKDDYFFRVMAPNIDEAKALAQCARETLGLSSLSIVFDLANEGYARGFALNFKAIFEGLGGIVPNILPFSSFHKPSFMDLAEGCLVPGTEGVLLVASAIDSALLCQHLKALNPRITILSSGWGMTEEFLNKGGKAVEGTLFSQIFYPGIKESSFLRFSKDFKARFGIQPNFAAVHAYEAVILFKEAMKEASKPSELKESLSKETRLSGPLGGFTIDRFGDAKRNRCLIIVKEGRFELFRKGP